MPGPAAEKIFRDLLNRHPSLRPCADDIAAAFRLLLDCGRRRGLILACGNGGSSADADHLVGELMKGFLLPRPLGEEARRMLEGPLPPGRGRAPLRETGGPAVHPIPGGTADRPGGRRRESCRAQARLLPAGGGRRGSDQGLEQPPRARRRVLDHAAGHDFGARRQHFPQPSERVAEGVEVLGNAHQGKVERADRKVRRRHEGHRFGCQVVGPEVGCERQAPQVGVSPSDGLQPCQRYTEGTPVVIDQEHARAGRHRLLAQPVQEILVGGVPRLQPVGGLGRPASDRQFAALE